MITVVATLSSPNNQVWRILVFVGFVVFDLFHCPGDEHPSTSDSGYWFRFQKYDVPFGLQCRKLMVACSNHGRWNQLDTEEDLIFFTTVCPDDCDHDGRHRGCDHGRHRDCAHEQHHHLLGWAPGTGCSLLKKLGINKRYTDKFDQKFMD